MKIIKLVPLEEWQIEERKYSGFKSFFAEYDTLEVYSVPHEAGEEYIIKLGEGREISIHFSSDGEAPKVGFTRFNGEAVIGRPIFYGFAELGGGICDWEGREK